MNSRKAGYRLLALFVSASASAFGADWLFKRGDPQQTGWQRDEKILTVRTVKGLRLLWKQKLNDGPNGLTDPLLLGPIITHRGIKELVFVRNSSDTVYAVDADLGNVFWSRRLEGDKSGACVQSLPLMPVMAPSASKAEDPAVADDDNFSDGNRLLYVLSGDSRLYALRPSTGGDFLPRLEFLPPGVKPVSLDIAGDVLYTITSSVCGGIPQRVWTLQLTASGLPADSNPQARPWEDHPQALTVFPWKGRDLLVTGTGSDKPAFLEAKTGRFLLQNTTPKTAHAESVATWQDAAGTRWIYTTLADGIRAFHVVGSADQPMAVPMWSSRRLTDVGPPVVANGILYFLSGDGSGLILHALDAFNGKDLYASDSIITSRVSSGNIAVANGHVCFSAADGILYCFGLPFEM